MKNTVLSEFKQNTNSSCPKWQEIHDSSRFYFHASPQAEVFMGFSLSIKETDLI